MTEPCVFVRLSTLTMAFGLWGWGGQEGESAPGQGEALIQLSEHLDTARITSPLLGLEAAGDVNELDDPALDVLLEEGFEDFDWGFAGWPEIPEAGIEADGAQEENHVLRLQRPPDDAALGWVLPVRPDSFYRFERAVRIEGVPFCDLFVVESRRDVDEAPLNSRALFLAGRGEALKTHSVPLRSGPDVHGVWQRASTSFYPTPRARSLIVLVRPRVGADPLASVLAMSFDDVRLEEVLPSSEERIQLLKGAYLAPDADPALGMRKAGCLLPLPTAEGARPGEPAESNYTWRRALYAPPTTEIAFDLRFPANARLRLATGLARETPTDAAARFQVELVELSEAGTSQPELLLDVVRTARMTEWNWGDVDLDLSAWAGRSGTLTLRTLAEKGDPHPLWANPRIDATGGVEGPLVILIAVDTLRADHLSSYGYARPTSPNLDRLAAEGVRFDQARANCNWTCPSFASIFTGLVPSRHGVSSYGPATPLPDELVTLAEHFQGEGWATRSIAYKVPLFDGNYEQGFDQAFNIPRDVIRGEENLARALEWLETHRGGPAFLFLHFNDPHQPFVQPEPYDRVFGAASATVEATAAQNEEQGQQQESTDLYDGAVAYVDFCIGEFLDALRERDLYAEASIAFVADHGEELYERGRLGHGGADLFDEVVRVPLIVKPPAKTFEPGRVVAASVSGFDVMPTLLDLAGIQPAQRLDARSLVPLIQGTSKELDRVVVTETSQRGLALVDSGYKFVLQPGGQAELLFHLQGDPRELHDIASERPQELARLRALALAYLLEHRPGNFLLVRSGQEPARLEISTRAVRTLVGPSARIEDLDGTSGSTVSLDAGAWCLLEVEDPEADEVVVHGLETRGAQTGFQQWIAGGLDSLTGTGVWRVRGPEPAGMADTSSEPVDAELLEALRRLGYAE